MKAERSPREKLLVSRFLALPQDRFPYVRFKRELNLSLRPGPESVFDRIQCDLVLFGKKRAYVCEAKDELDRAVFGDVFTALAVFRELYPGYEATPVIIYRKGKPILEWCAKKLGVELFQVD